MKIKFDIIKQHDNYIVRRTDGDYTMHAHLSSMQGCKMLLSFINNNMLPTSDWLQGSCRRLLTAEEYSMLKKKRQRYVNVNKRIR